MEGSIFNKNGEHEFEYLKKIVRTEVKIDFGEETVKIYITLPQNNSKNEKARNNLIGNVINGRIRKRIVFKHFKISKDFSTVTIDNYDWCIPQIFNKKAIKQQNIKTWEMIFYYIFKIEINETTTVAKKK